MLTRIIDVCMEFHAVVEAAVKRPTASRAERPEEECLRPSEHLDDAAAKHAKQNLGLLNTPKSPNENSKRPTS